METPTEDPIESMRQAIQAALDMAQKLRDGKPENGRFMHLTISNLELAQGWAKRLHVDSPDYPSDVELDEAVERGKAIK